MAKKETENDELASNSNDLKEPLLPVSVETEKKDQNFRVPIINSTYKLMQRRIKRHKKNKLLCPEPCTEDSRKRSKVKKRTKKLADVEIASDKNIATLLRSERLLEFIKKGRKIPYEIGRNISQKTGFKSVSDLNNYISAHRKKFIVLVDKKEKYCQSDSQKCNGAFRRTDSVDLDLYFTHHFGDSAENSAT
ncbi:uncharacterized protein LOC100114777 [Nasonia vitripennis]|uniref:Uncharacterized protein n=1 Tax=Nasonia vitripennis TaxID=7425 RepID=A0A7M7LK19_NASVI|nr:uncharacterized protein LOC100114777 [Nasonia vitripennis]